MVVVCLQLNCGVRWSTGNLFLSFMGYVVGHVIGDENIELVYHCITVDDELMASWPHGTVSVDDLGRINLRFDCAWYTGDQIGGPSQYVEVDD
jgi:hypothetical protein